MIHSPKIPTTFIIFGATGDLAVKKLFPSLYTLFKKGKLPDAFSILAVSRRDWGDIDFRSFIRQKIDHHLPDTSEDFVEFINKIHYSKVLFDKNEGYVELHDKLRNMDVLLGARAQKLFYLSLAPTFYENVFTWLGEAEIFEDRSSRLLIEKPFGTSEESSDGLHKILKKHLKERQMLFVDHYLGKDTLRAVRALHSSSSDFGSIFTNKDIESIRLRIFETHSIDKRASSYDSVGAFRDVAQNHMMVMLSTVVAPCRGPLKLFCHLIRANLISSLALADTEGSWTRGGQYLDYTKEDNVPKDSQTETAFSFNTIFTKGRLKDVRVMFEGGKKLGKASASVEIFLKNGEEVIVNIQPEQSIVTKSLSGADSIAITKKGDAYEHIFLGAINHDTRMFTSFHEIKASWKLTDSVVASLQNTKPVLYSPEKPFVV